MLCCYSPATFLAARLRALAYARTLHPTVATIDLLSDPSPAIAPIRAAHHHISSLRASAASAYAACDAADPTVDTFGVPAFRFHPGGLPSADASAIPLEPCDPDPDVPAPTRFPSLRQIPSLAALSGLDPSYFKGSLRTFSAAIHHHAWASLYTSSPARDAALLISQSQPHALSFLSADLSDKASLINTPFLRPALLYHLCLPQLATDPAGADRHGDISLNTTNATRPHNLCRDSHFLTAVSAYGAAAVELEPADHAGLLF